MRHSTSKRILFPLIALLAITVSCRSHPGISERYAFAEGDTLRQYAEHTGLLLGTVGLHRQLFGPGGKELGELIGREFNLLWPDAVWRDTEPEEGKFDFTKVNALASFAEDNDMSIKGFAGPWHLLNPDWLDKKSFAEIGSVLQRHIVAEMSRRKGGIKIYDVFDELVNDTGDGLRNRQAINTESAWAARSPWVDGGDTSLIEAGFRTARLTDPAAYLFLNEYGNEDYYGTSLSSNQEKGKFFFDFVARMRKKGVPIDGVGFQLHEVYPAAAGAPDLGPGRLEAYLKNIDATVKLYAAQGLLVEFSEVDVQLKLSDLDLKTEKGKAELQKRLEYQARIFEGLMRVALNNRNVVAVTIWMPSDKYPSSFIDGYGKPHIFDENLLPKPAYDRLLYALKEKAASEAPQPPRLR